MNLRWLWFDYVDPQLDLTREQRRLVRRMAREFLRIGKVRLYRPWLGIVVGLGVMLVIFAPYAAAIHFDFVPAGFISAMTFYVASQVIAWIVCASIARILWKSAVIAALRQHGCDVCIECGYLLRGLPLTVMHCPECGTKRDNPLID